MVASNTTEDSIRNVLGGVESTFYGNAPLPPSLAEIQKQDTGPVKNMTYNQEDEMKRKRELLFRFDILKRSYKEANIPEFSEYTDIATMEQIYEDTVRKVGLESKVEGYKKFLTMGFFGVEFLFTNFLKVDMTGFAKQQMSTMGTYERLLIELGEKAMLEKSKSQWPVEVRLLFTIVMNAVLFLLMKNVLSGGVNNMMGSLMGAATNSMSGNSSGGDMFSGIMNMVSGLSGGGGVSAPTAPSVPKAKPKMKGPSINMDDVDKQKVN